MNRFMMNMNYLLIIFGLPKHSLTAKCKYRE
jgi:hypothetical protein